MKSIYLLCTCLFIFSCVGEQKHLPDISNIEANTKINHIEKYLRSIDTTKQDVFENLVKQDSSFFNLYFQYVLNIPLQKMTSDQKNQMLIGFLSDKRIIELREKADSIYSDFSVYENRFNEAFRYMKYYFPKRQIPQLYTYISEYSLQKFLFKNQDDQDCLALGLDMFLGKDYPYRKYIGNSDGFSEYLTQFYDPSCIVRNGMEAVVYDILGEESNQSNMLERMIHNGKKLYVLSLFLPDLPDYEIIQYTKEQWDWCEKNEQEIWAYFLKQELFYSTDLRKIAKYVSPSPNSPGMPKEAPGRTANYIGWQIVKSYMKRYPDTNLEDFINLGTENVPTNSQAFLKKSKFKPKRK